MVNKFIDEYMTNFGREPSYAVVVEYATTELRKEIADLKLRLALAEGKVIGMTEGLELLNAEKDA